MGNNFPGTKDLVLSPGLDDEYWNGDCDCGYDTEVIGGIELDGYPVAIGSDELSEYDAGGIDTDVNPIY